MTTDFTSISFDNSKDSIGRLERMMSEERRNLAEHLTTALKECAAPDAVLIRLERFLKASPNLDACLDRLDETRLYTRLLLLVLDQGQFLTNILCKNPEFMEWLWAEVSLTEPYDAAAIATELIDTIQHTDTFPDRMAVMRHFRRREILRIACREVFAHVSVKSLTQDLSNLADAMLQVAIQCAEDELEPRYGQPLVGEPPNQIHAGFVILAMGKLGGCELNFSSDIDLVFLYSDEGETSGGSGGPLSNAEYVHKLGELIIRAISEDTPDGHIFRVDMRLRPHGRMGPLAVSIESAFLYYEQTGQAWERQALIKARAVAGDESLGKEFIDSTRPFVFPKFFDDDTLNEIHTMKSQMEAQIERRGQADTEVKLGRGGIRDVEFTIQILQLLNGGRLKALRTGNTLEAIAALGRHNLLSPFDAATLDSNYNFMRQVEHRLQIAESQQVHALPTDPAALDTLARHLGYQNGPAFMNVYRDRTRETRAILEQFLATEGAGNLWVTDLLDRRSEGEEGLEKLHALGVRDVQKARKELHLLAYGAPDQPHSQHARQLFTEVAPTLLTALSRCADPDATLVRLGHIITNLRAPGTIYDMLTYKPHLCDYLVSLAENSEYLSEILIRDPGLFDTLGMVSSLAEPPQREDLEHLVDALSRGYDAEATLYRFQAGEILRIGMRDLFTDATVSSIGRELTTVAEICLANALKKARVKTAERFGPTDAPFAVLGVGKMGGRELGYGSDLDLVFVYDNDAHIESGAAPTEYFVSIASRTLKMLKEPTRYGLLYDVDARLRPDGRKGTLAISTNRLREYYTTEAQAWERLALMKARAMAGDTAFADEVAREALDLAYSLPLTRENLTNIEETRKKIVAQASPFDLKKHQGGIAEIESTVRLNQLRHAADAPQVRCSEVKGALDALVTIDAVSEDDARTLMDAYRLLRRIENRIRISKGRSGSSLPANEEDRIDLARRLGIDGDITRLVEEHKERVHALYTQTLKSLLSVAG